jgi:hypothetical protein
MKSKTQRIDLVFHGKKGLNPAIYCPFTGVKLINEDPSMEIENYPESVLAVWMGDPIPYDFPVFNNSTFEMDFSLLSEKEDINEVVGLINEYFIDLTFLIFTVSIYGNAPGDYGRYEFLMRVPD